MATLILLEQWIGWLGGLSALIFFGVIFYGIWRGLQRAPKVSDGGKERWLLKPAFYILTGLAYFGLCWLLWKPLPITLSPFFRALALAIGTLLFFPGLGLALWGRLALGRFYFVSSGFGAPLYPNHQLITKGPFAIVRHPMYVGIFFAGLGGLLIYRTWTMVFIALNFLGLVVRARREEEALHEKFGQQWVDYCQRTPRWIPKLRWKQEN